RVPVAAAGAEPDTCLPERGCCPRQRDARHRRHGISAESLACTVRYPRRTDAQLCGARCAAWRATGCARSGKRLRCKSAGRGHPLPPCAAQRWLDHRLSLGRTTQTCIARQGTCHVSGALTVMTTLELFPMEVSDEPERIGPGAFLLRGFALRFVNDLLPAVRQLEECSPFRNMATPGGRTMSVALT